MPCDTIQTSTVEFRLENTDIELLKLAMREIGYNLQPVSNLSLIFTRVVNRCQEKATFWNEKMSITTTSTTPESMLISEVKRSYARQVVKATAKRFGWKLKEKGPNRFQVCKGR